MNAHENPAYLIDDVTVMQICTTRASNCNSDARNAGQQQRLTATELYDLYYAQGGRCALSGIPLEHFGRIERGTSIQLDHIVEQKKRAAINAVSSGQVVESGAIADIDNVQWVCKSANQLKELCRKNEMPMATLARAIAEQSANDFSIRSQCHHLGAKGRREFRERFLLEQSKKTPSISAKRLTEMLEGTPGHACYQAVIRHMRELGLDINNKSTWPEKRKSVLLKLMDECSLRFMSVEQFLEIANSRIDRDDGFSMPQWRYTALGLGLSFVFENSRKYQVAARGRVHVSAGDRQNCLAMAKVAGDDGLDMQSLKSQCEAGGIPSHLIEETIKEAVESGALYEHEGKIFAALSRKEAATIIGVSPNRLKKWGRSDWHDQFAGPPFVKKSEKGLTFYKRHEIKKFAEERAPHLLDLQAAGPREGCVAGGAIGGKSAQINRMHVRALRQELMPEFVG
jgi:hypothetical protein